jgi:hypothetical protein
VRAEIFSSLAHEPAHQPCVCTSLLLSTTGKGGFRVRPTTAVPRASAAALRITPLVPPCRCEYLFSSRFSLEFLCICYRLASAAPLRSSTRIANVSGGDCRTLWKSWVSFGNALRFWFGGITVVRNTSLPGLVLKNLSLNPIQLTES